MTIPAIAPPVKEFSFELEEGEEEEELQVALSIREILLPAIITILLEVLILVLVSLFQPMILI